MKRYRNEWKYILSDASLSYLRNRLDAVLTKDIHTNFNGIYVVHNIYFDDYKNTCAKEVESGNIKRYKWRIRYYNDDVDTIRLEYKEKLYGRCHKETCPLKFSEYNAILKGDVTTIFWETKERLLKLFCIDIMKRCFRPKLIIEYEREAYVDELLNIRITFDKNICVSYEISKFLTGDYIKIPLQDKCANILEVKFDDILPGYIKDIIMRECDMQMAFSKYYTGFKMLEVLR